MTDGVSAPPSSIERASPTAAVRVLDRAGILVDDVQVHQPSLDDVFLALTGRETAEEEAANEPEAATA